jgi:Ca2+-transporting ATPase
LGSQEQNSWLDGIAILAAVVVISLVSSINNYSKDRQFRQLNKSRTDQLVKVLRGGKEIQVNVTDVNVGDVIVLEQGDNVPADGLYIEGFNCSVDESNMTGESDAIHKNENKPFMISGSTIAEGSCRMLTMQVGSRSEWGKTLAQLHTPDEEETPLQKKLARLAYFIGIVGVIAAVITFVILFIYWIVNDVANKPWAWSELRTLVQIFIIGVTVIVVAVPEGLPLAVTISLAYSMKEMLKDKNLVRHLDACETMGGATNICSDKTGTLTENRMTVVQGMLATKKFQEVPPRELPPKEILDLIMKNICVNSKAVLNEEEGKPIEFIGNKTECALLVFAKKLGYDYVKIRAECKETIKTVYDFSSARKRMSTVVKLDLKQSPNKRFRIFTKGASEIILNRCTKWIDHDGTVRDLDNEALKNFSAFIDSMAEQALRTLCLAYRDFTPNDFMFDAHAEPPETELTLLAIVGIEDPLRPPVVASVRDCRRAGIFVRMVTGDNIKTAKKIAENCGILTPTGIAMEGPQFAKLTDEEVDDILPRLQVLARSSPQDKFKLVHRLRANGEVVAVTGDGTNDALALKEADIGLAMGIAGTAVAKEASDIIILDDNFVSIVKAVIWGRSVYDNIRKFLQFQLTVNFSALIVVVVSAVTDYGTPLTSIQLLWVSALGHILGLCCLILVITYVISLNDKSFLRSGQYDYGHSRIIGIMH